MHSKMKLFEIRDKCTFMPFMAFKMYSEIEQERWLMGRAGYGRTPSEHKQYIFFAPIDGSVFSKIAFDWSDWGDRTRARAHRFIEEHFDELESGAVIDVEFILGESAAPKISEREEGV